jgi:hypothetical protein
VRVAARLAQALAAAELLAVAGQLLCGRPRPNARALLALAEYGDTTLVTRPGHDVFYKDWPRREAARSLPAGGCALVFVGALFASALAVRVVHLIEHIHPSSDEPVTPRGLRELPRWAKTRLRGGKRWSFLQLGAALLPVAAAWGVGGVGSVGRFWARPSDGPGRPGAVKRHWRLPIQIHFVCGFCMGVQTA